MHILRQLGIILMISFSGSLIQKILNTTIPGNVIGMLILLAFLYVGLIKVEQIAEIAHFLLKHLAFFFIPAGVGLITQFEILHDYWVGFLAVCLITTIITMIVTGLTVQILKVNLLKRRQKNV